MPELSVCMIGRDEADILPMALESLREYVDEIIYVDTGSVDGSAELAAGMGARVFHRPWSGDFSAARNYSLGLATGDWLLVLDCDEILDQRGQRRVRELMQGPTDRVYIMSQRNYTKLSHVPEFTANDGRCAEATEWPGWVPATQIRLFPARHRLGYVGKVHESLSGSTVAKGLAIVDAEIPIHHFGKVRDEAVMARKERLYVELSRRKLKDSPKDPVAWHEMGVQHLELKEHAEAEACFEKVLALGGVSGERWAGSHAFLARLGALRGEGKAASKRLKAAWLQQPEHRILWEALISLQLAEGHFLEASYLVAQAREKFPEDLALLQQEATLLGELRQWAEAAQAWKRVGERIPAFPPAERGHALASFLADAERGLDIAAAQYAQDPEGLADAIRYLAAREDLGRACRLLHAIPNCPPALITALARATAGHGELELARELLQHPILLQAR